jgi:hypothetical protein
VIDHTAPDQARLGGEYRGGMFDSPRSFRLVADTILNGRLAKPPAKPQDTGNET